VVAAAPSTTAGRRVSGGRGRPAATRLPVRRRRRLPGCLRVGGGGYKAACASAAAAADTAGTAAIDAL